MLERTLKLSEENNKIIRRVRRTQNVASLMRTLYWVVIIAIGVASYYFVSPYIEEAQNFVGESQDTINGFKNLLPK